MSVIGYSRMPPKLTHDDRPYGMQCHWLGGSAENPREYALEFWPLKGRWQPFFVAIPIRFRRPIEYCYVSNGLRGDAAYARRPPAYGEGVVSRDKGWWL